MFKSIISTKENREWQGIPGIEVTKSGKLIATFYSGGKREPDKKNNILINESNDFGITWSSPEIVMDMKGKTRVYDPTLWHDPDGRLWLIYNQARLKKDFSAWGKFCYDYDSEKKWSDPIKFEFNYPYAIRMNKPIVLKNGDWVLPMTWSKKLPKRWFQHGDALQGVIISSDKGLTWKVFGEVKAPNWALENMIIEKKDKTLWMLIRAGGGYLWESYSKDYGRTWSEGKATQISSPGSRFFIGRLKSGRMLLINSFRSRGRKDLCVALSDDEGATFPKKLIVDERDGVSYPDAVEDENGNIHIVYDRDRKGIGEINYVRLTESDILNVE